MGRATDGWRESTWGRAVLVGGGLVVLFAAVIWVRPAYFMLVGKLAGPSPLGAGLLAFAPYGLACALLVALPLGLRDLLGPRSRQALVAVSTALFVLGVLLFGGRGTTSEELSAMAGYYAEAVGQEIVIGVWCGFLSSLVFLLVAMPVYVNSASALPRADIQPAEVDTDSGLRQQRDSMRRRLRWVGALGAAWVVGAATLTGYLAAPSYLGPERVYPKQRYAVAGHTLRLVSASSVQGCMDASSRPRVNRVMSRWGCHHTIRAVFTARQTDAVVSVAIVGLPNDSLMSNAWRKINDLAGVEPAAREGSVGVDNYTGVGPAAREIPAAAEAGLRRISVADSLVSITTFNDWNDTSQILFFSAAHGDRSARSTDRAVYRAAGAVRTVTHRRLGDPERDFEPMTGDSTPA